MSRRARFELRLSKAERTDLELLALRWGCSTSDAVRRAVRRQLRAERAWVADLLRAFPEFESDEPVPGADLVDWIAARLRRRPRAGPR